MNLVFNTWLVVLVLFGFFQGKSSNAPYVNERLPINLSVFTENKGQIGDGRGGVNREVLFQTNYGAASVFFTATGLNFLINKLISKNTKIPDRRMLEKESEWDSKTSLISFSLEGSNPNVNIEALDQLPYYSNFYYPHCADGVTKVAQYKKIVYKEVYPKIDMVFYYQGKKLKFDFVIHPGGDPSQIRYQYKGNERLNISNSPTRLSIKNTMASINEEIIYAYSLKDYHTKEVVCWYRENQEKGNIGYQMGNYDKTATLVIDPQLTLEWCTLFGGDGNEGEAGGSDINPNITVDASDNLLLASSTTSATAFPLLDDATAYHDATLGGANDVYIAKFNSSGVQQWTTFYGGSLSDAPSGNAICIEADASSNVYIAGRTASTDFPCLDAGGYYDNTKNGSSQDLFIIKLSNTGARSWATYYGGDKTERLHPNGITVDGNDNLYLTFDLSAIGGTGYDLQDFSGSATDYYLTTAASMMILRFDNTTALKWGTFFEYCTGTGEARGIKTDNGNNVYIMATVSSAGLDTEDDGVAYFDGTRDAGEELIWARFNNILELKHSTYFGTLGGGQTWDMAFNSTGELFIVGDQWAAASGFPLLDNGTAYYDANYDASGKSFIAWFNADGSQKHCTLFGGGGNWTGFLSVAIDGFDNIYIGGFTDGGLSITDYGDGSYYQSSQYGAYDGIMLGFHPTLAKKWTTYFGGDDGHSDFLHSLVVDASDNIYSCGSVATSTTNFPITNKAGAYNDATLSARDDYIVKFSPAAWPLPIELIAFDGECIASEVKLNWTTATETNNDFFVIERAFISPSSSGVAIKPLTGDEKVEFTTIAAIKGAGNSSILKKYQIIDPSPLPQGLTAYYRIKQVDYDGKFSYSKVLAVSPCREDNISFSVYPNPFIKSQNRKLSMNINSYKGEKLQLIVYDLKGNKLFSESIIADKSNFNLLMEETANLQRGVYLMQVVLEDGSSIEERLLVD